MKLLRRFSPKPAIDDFANEWRRPNPHRWTILGVAVAATFAILAVFLPESQRAVPQPPQVTYITTWSPDRTREEIIASNLANQARKDERAAERARREEARREAYRAIGRATFVDVDAMEAEIERDRAAEAAAGRPAATPSATERPAASDQ